MVLWVVVGLLRLCHVTRRHGGGDVENCNAFGRDDDDERTSAPLGCGTLHEGFDGGAEVRCHHLRQERGRVLLQLRSFVGD